MIIGMELSTRLYFLHETKKYLKLGQELRLPEIVRFLWDICEISVRFRSHEADEEADWQNASGKSSWIRGKIFTPAKSQAKSLTKYRFHQFLRMECHMSPIYRKSTLARLPSEKSAVVCLGFAQTAVKGVSLSPSLKKNKMPPISPCPWISNRCFKGPCPALLSNAFLSRAIEYSWIKDFINLVLPPFENGNLFS